MGEGSLPLAQLAYVEVLVVVGRAARPARHFDVRRGVLGISPYVHGQKVDGVSPLRGEVVKSPYEPLAPVWRSGVEDRVSCVPVLYVGREGELGIGGVVKA